MHHPFIKISIAVLLLLTHSPAAFAQQDKLYRDDATGVSFSYPADWVIKSSRTGVYKVVVGDPDAIGGSCMLGVNVTPELLKYTDQAAIEGTTAQDIEADAEKIGNPTKVTLFKRTKVGNRPAIYFESSGSFESLGFKVDLSTLAVVIKRRDKLVSLGCTAASSIINRLSSRFDKVLGSVVVLP